MKTAFVLSGGGAKGSFQVGVMKELAEQGIIPDHIFGTSVGAINAVGYRSRGPVGLETFWRHLRGITSIFKFNWPSIWFAAQGIFNSSPLKKLMQEGYLPVLNPHIKATVTKVHIGSGKLVHVNNDSDNFLESVLASAAIPGIVEPINGYVDGGVRNQIPLQIVFDTMPEVDRIVVILCNPYILQETAEKTSRSWANNAMRSLDILQHAVFVKDIEACILKNAVKKYRPVRIDVYAPISFFGGSLDFRPHSIEKGIDHGVSIAKLGPVKSAQADG